MTTNRIQRTMRISVLSTFLALVAFTFFAFGSASAHTLSHPTGVAQSPTVVVKIINNKQGGTLFSPSAITVKSGTVVKIVNKTQFMKLLFTDQGLKRLGSGAFLLLTATQSQGVGICGGGSLSITVV